LWKESFGSYYRKWKSVRKSILTSSISVTWGNPDQGKLGHGSKLIDDPDKLA
jgi:hypothetical protein